MEITFGHGRIAVSSGKRLRDNILILEKNLGTGVIGAPVPARPKDLLLNPTHESVVLAFENPESVDVVIKELTNVKEYFSTGLTDAERARLEREEAERR